MPLAKYVLLQKSAQNYLKKTPPFGEVFSRHAARVDNYAKMSDVWCVRVTHSFSQDFTSSVDASAMQGVIDPISRHQHTNIVLFSYV